MLSLTEGFFKIEVDIPVQVFKVSIQCVISTCIRTKLNSNRIFVGILPRSWSHYTVPAGMTVIQWVSDFSERIKQLQNISQAAASGGAKELKVPFADFLGLLVELCNCFLESSGFLNSSSVNELESVFSEMSVNTAERLLIAAW